MIPDCADKQKYQNNIQLFPGAAGIPASFLFYLYPSVETTELAAIIQPNQVGNYGSATMESMDCAFVDVGELGTGSKEVAVIYS